ncbi:uncharacterized protein LOC127151227 isoform X4 [Cucumis melo]|uniref:Uncharacterized protein LOC127151227 isoform X4 n=1 Tax=Cucumis melo TaxID=3656 RepID=A0ABM3L9E3_CUCME|nr:uncharacterized protein LOC127151227 isoform X4 [Cucumis melo]XP_050946627.1 uncharacterized protein LOC127151227 isoform X4 [Cucumis melo]
MPSRVCLRSSGLLVARSASEATLNALTFSQILSETSSISDSLWSKVNEDIHGFINVGLKTWQAEHDLQRYRSTPKWKPVKGGGSMCKSTYKRYYIILILLLLAFQLKGEITELKAQNQEFQTQLIAMRA